MVSEDGGHLLFLYFFSMGINLIKMIFLRSTKNILRKKWGIPDEKIILLGVGVLEVKKIGMPL